MNWAFLIDYRTGINMSVRVCQSVCPVCPEDVFKIAQPFVTRSDMVVHHCRVECNAKQLGTYLQHQCHSEGLNNQNLTGSSELIILLQSNLL